jgi:N-carbamoylputrescine amidase
MKLSFTQWPAGLMPSDTAWLRVAKQVREARPDVLVTNEMPFGDWLALSPSYDSSAAARSVKAHEEGLDALRELDVPLLLSSRPVFANDRLANEGFALYDCHYQRLHHKHYFPAEPGWHEDRWFGCASQGFELANFGALKVGMLLCTELMFNEHARAYGAAGAHLIVVPRATGVSVRNWHTACQMAAIVSGAYVVSSNRESLQGDVNFGGVGMAYAPDGDLIAVTTPTLPLISITLDLARADAQKHEYPCYVARS